MTIQGHKRNLLTIAVVLCGLGVMGSAVGTYNTIRSQVDPLSTPMLCGSANCAEVYGSRLAMPLGIPLAWVGFLFYLWLCIVLLLTISGRCEADTIISAGLIGSTLAMVLSFGLALYLVIVLRSFCPTCLLLYTINAALGVVFFLLFRRVRSLRVATGTAPIQNSLSFQRTVNVPLLASITLFATAGLMGMGMFVKFIGAYTHVDIQQEVRIHFDQPKRSLPCDPSIPVRGNPDAPIVMALFSDFQCPYCAHASHLLQKLIEDQPDVQLRFIHYPLDKSINQHTPQGDHLMSGLAARAAVCAHKRGGFWDYHDAVFSRQRDIDRQTLLALAVDHGWQQEDFSHAMESASTMMEVQRHIEIGWKARVDGTPTVFINGRCVRLWNNARVLQAIIRDEQKELAAFRRN
jgi:protein-disulfide isomerase/uncharacterized membrane protein